jgi:hypothetical protein
MAGDDLVVAYFGLAAHSVVRAELPRKIARGAPDAIPAVLLARLAPPAAGPEDQRHRRCPRQVTPFGIALSTARHSSPSCHSGGHWHALAEDEGKNLPLQCFPRRCARENGGQFVRFSVENSSGS